MAVYTELQRAPSIFVGPSRHMSSWGGTSDSNRAHPTAVGLRGCSVSWRKRRRSHLERDFGGGCAILPPRDRLSGADLKPVRAAAVKSRGGERRIKSPRHDL